MTGADFLNTLCGSSTVHGLLDKNVLDTKYRATMLGWLNLTLKDIANRQVNWHWRWLEKTSTAPTVADQMDYDLPTDIDTNKLFAIYDRTTDRTYKYVPYERFISQVPDPTNSAGDTIIWTFWAKAIKLYPIPDSVITFYLNYVGLATAWTDAATSNELPTKYDQIIIDGALVYAYKFDPDMGDWKTQQMAYEAGVQRMIQDNNMMIADRGETGSHRIKYFGGELYPITS